MTDYTPTEDELKTIELLESYKQAINDFEYKRDSDRKALRAYINQNTIAVRRVVDEAQCFNTVTLIPPPAIGGPIMRNIDPFLTLFDRPFRKSMVPRISDMIDRTIGVIRAGEYDKSHVRETNESHEELAENHNSDKVFIVHGHDGEAKEQVARFLDKLGLQAIILHEQTSRGKTIIEKLEYYTDVAYAVILLTPDDLGCPADEQDKLTPRARQNVVFELGYLIAKLGREHVCALVKGEVERPSDYDGVVYVNMDQDGGWKLRVANEMKEQRISIDLNKLS